MTVHRTLIVEDNAVARMDLLDRLAQHPEIAVIGQAESVGKARPLLSRRDYDLVFLDIQLRGSNAFELIPDISPEARVIFVTAYDEYAVRAFEVNAFDYLLKPVEPERLAHTLARLQATPPLNAELATEAPFSRQLQRDDVVHVRQPTGCLLVPVADISGIIAAQNYTELWKADGSKLMVRRSMKDWEEHLNPLDFVRAARDTLINLHQVVKSEATGNRGGQVWLQGREDPVSASFRQWPQVKSRLSAITTD